MLFRKRSKRSIPPPYRKNESEAGPNSGLYPIDYEMMLKGAITQRKGVSVRQIGVYVSGAVRLVTSGDRVDRETYEALLADGVIRPPAETGSWEMPKESPPKIIEDNGPSTEY